MKILAALLASLVIIPAGAENSSQDNKLVILHTNDTHSQILPNEKDLGGCARRMALIDSVRQAEPNVVLVDAGDAVQGSLYFSLFGGEVERKLMNRMAYDIKILGNHEFDNGIESLAATWGPISSELITTNYDLRATPLDPLFKPFTIKEWNGKKVGFIGINLQPYGMIEDHKWEGVVYLDPVKAANATAWHLKHNERVDYVVALTHIGYDDPELIDDLELAANTENIDIIIGGHTHTSIDPQKPDCPTYKVANLAGDTVLIAQNGKGGVTVGEITLDLESGSKSSRLISVDNRFDLNITPSQQEIIDIIAPYTASVDSVKGIVVSKAAAEFPHRSTEQINLMGDLAMAIGEKLAGKKVDLAISNKGGARCPIPKGIITKGLIMEMLPFDNRFQVLEIKGDALVRALDVMAGRGGDAVSKGVEVTFDPATRRCTKILLNGEPIDPDKTYTLATINYLANGGDYMEPLREGKVIATSDVVLYEDVANYLRSKGGTKKPLKPDTTLRMKPTE